MVEEIMSQAFVVILGMSVTASAVILAVAAARLCLKGMPRIYSYALWAVAGLRLILPVSLSAPFGLLSGRPVPWDLAYMAQPRVDLGISGLNAAINRSLPAATPYASANPMQIWIFLAAVVWAAGIGIGLAAALIGYARLRWRVRDAAMLEPGVRVSKRVGTPFVLGLFRPQIYLPAGLSAADQRHVLLHERAHIARGDHWVSLLGWALRGVHWFNPLVWLAHSLMRRDMESSCDERVVRRMDQQGRCDYADSLVAAARRRGFSGGLAFAEPPVGQRVRRVLRARQPARWVGICVSAALVALAVCLLVNASGEPGAQPPSSSAALMSNPAPSETELPETPYGMFLEMGADGEAGFYTRLFES